MAEAKQHNADTRPAEAPVASSPAAQPLADALRVSFGLLKIVMFVLLAIFVLAGSLHYVGQQQVAIRLRLGRVVGDPGEQILQPGLHFALPEPIDRIVRIRVTEQTVSPKVSFWFHETDEEKLKSLDEKRVPRGGLDPEKDGFLLTGDRNIVHGRWKVRFKVDTGGDGTGPLWFAQNVGGMQQAKALVRQVAEQAIVRTVAGISVDEFLEGTLGGRADSLETIIQDMLDGMRSGITVTGVDLEKPGPKPPLALRKDFDAVTAASAERDRAIQEAEGQQAAILGRVAGADYQALLDAIDEYERARRRGENDAAATAERRIAGLLQAPQVRGEIAEIISRAEAYQKTAVQKVRGEAERFLGLLAAGTRNAEVVRSRLWQDAVQEILSADVEKIFLPGKAETILEISRDPRIQRRREAEQYKPK